MILKHRRVLTEDEWKQISGSDLSGTMVANNLQITGNVEFGRGDADKLTDWLEENLQGSVYVFFKEKIHRIGIAGFRIKVPEVVYFELKKDAVTFKMFWENQ